MSKEFRYINPNDLPYPNTLGKGAGKCVIWSIFSNLNLYSTSYNLYSVMSAKDMFEMSSQNEKLLQCCCRSWLCGPIISKMKEGRYEAKFENQSENDYRDDIFVSCRNGKYSLYEGKHRVCIAKRLNIELVPAIVEVYEYEKKELYKKMRKLESYNSKKCTCENILAECIKIYTNLGLSVADIHELNEVIGNKGMLEFIEERSGKSIAELARV